MNDVVPAKVSVALAIFDSFSSMNGGSPAEPWQDTEDDDPDDKYVKLLDRSVDILLEYLNENLCS